MATVGIFEAKNRLSEYVERASRGEEIVITRHGEVMARLVPPAHAVTNIQARALAERIRGSRKGHLLGEGVTLRELVDEGRKP